MKSTPSHQSPRTYWIETLSFFLPLALLALATSLSVYADDGDTTPKWNWNGDLRYRIEQVAKQGKNPGGYMQNNLRFRVGAGVTAGKELSFDFRLATGTGEVTTNQSLGASNSMFANYSILLDRASASYRPADEWEFLVGRTRNYLWAPIGSDLVWDADLNFDGLAVVTKWKAGDVEILPTLGFAWVNYNKSATLPNNLLLNLQLAAKQKTESFSWGLDVAMADFSNFAGQTPNPSVTAVTVNNTLRSGTFAYDYHLINFGGEFGLPVMGSTWFLTADYVTNPAAPANKNGYLFGTRYGAKVAKKGDWMASYDYRRVEKDAVLSNFTDNDFLAGEGTDGTGHRIAVAYGLIDHFNLGANIYLGQYGLAAGGATQNRNKLQVDFMYSF